MITHKRAFVAAASTALLMSACVGSPPTPGPTGPSTGGAGNADGLTTATTPSPSGTAAPVRDANVDLVIWCDNGLKPILDTYGAKFAKANGITVQVQVSTDVRRDFTDATNAGKGPDVIVGAHNWLGDLVATSSVEPVQLSADQEAKFAPQSIAAAKLNGQLYGVPYAVENIGIVRNTDLAPDAPKTFEEMVEKGTAAVQAGKATNAVLLQVGKTGDAYHAYPFLKAFGGGVFAQKDNGDYDPSKVLVNSVGSVQGGDQLAALGKAGVLSTDVDLAVAESVFDAGKAPYFMTGPWAIGKAKKGNIKYAISPLPTIGGKQMEPFLGVQMFYVAAKAKNDAFAQEFVTNYVSRKDLQVDMFTVGKRSPALSDASAEVSATDPDVMSWSEAGKNALPVPNIPAMDSVWGPLGQAEADIISQKGGAQARLDAAQAEIVANIAKG